MNLARHRFGIAVEDVPRNRQRDTEPMEGLTRRGAFSKNVSRSREDGDRHPWTVLLFGTS